MSKRPKEKDDALEALDFIINVLKEHEKDLDRLINELGTITERLGNKGHLATKVENVEERLTTIQDQITNLISYLSAPKTQETTLETPQIPQPQPQPQYHRGPPVIVKCKQWEDFKTLATQAEAVSYLYKETEKTFQADALKNSKVLTYNGETPKDTNLLKIWLSKELKVPEEKIFEGILAIG